MVEGLIWAVAIFAAGSFLVLERRCLGQRALVQPLALCLIIGWFVDNVSTGLWLGIVLQLLSVAPSRSVDWAYASAVSSAALLTSDYFGVHLYVGQPETTALMLVAIVTGMGVRNVERFFAKQDRNSVDQHPPWQQADPVRAIEKTVYRATSRWFFLGGLEVSVGLALALVAINGVALVPDPPAWVNRISAVALPAVGVAVAVSVLTGRRFILWAGASTGGMLVLYSVVS